MKENIKLEIESNIPIPEKATRKKEPTMKERFFKIVPDMAVGDSIFIPRAIGTVISYEVQYRRRWQARNKDKPYLLKFHIQVEEQNGITGARIWRVFNRKVED